MFRLISLFLGAIVRLLRRRQSLLLENLALQTTSVAVEKKGPPTQADKIRFARDSAVTPPIRPAVLEGHVREESRDRAVTTFGTLK